MEKDKYRIEIRLNPKIDGDVINFLDSLDNKAGFIKNLLREHIRYRLQVNYSTPSTMQEQITKNMDLQSKKENIDIKLSDHMA